MPLIHFQPDDRAIVAESAETILHASLRASIPHTHACGGQGRCSTCRVMVVDGLQHCAPRNGREQLMADRLGFCPAVRLACQSTLRADVRVRRLVLDEEDVALVEEERAVPTALGQEKWLAILFADIRGFTPFAEALPAYDVIHVLNRYHHRMRPIIERNGGSINNCMGDGLLVLFGLQDASQAALQAVTAGAAMLEAMGPFNQYLHQVYGRTLRIGIGIHCGEIVLGAISSSGWQSITAIGDAVNLASRIESANKVASTSFLVSAETHELVKEHVRAGQRLRLELPGKKGEYELWEILGLA